MSEPIFVLRYLDKRPHQPFKVQGQTVKTGLCAHFDPKYQAHVLRMKASDYFKVGADLAQGTHRPMCNFYICAIEGMEEPSKLDAKLAEAEAEIARLTWELMEARAPRTPPAEAPPSPKSLDEMSQREMVKYAQDRKMKGYSMAAQSGKPDKLRAFIRAYETTLAPSGSGDSAPAESRA
jgi:hypothetical protein